MAQSFLQGLFGQRKRSRDGLSLGLTATSDLARLTELKSQEPQPKVQDVPPAAKRNSLFAFVDPKDPFAAGEIAGEELPGPIISIMSARQFGTLFLFHTPHTSENTLSTKDELSRRYSECLIEIYELPISDPKDYSCLMGLLARLVRNLVVRARVGDSYVCVSSGTAEMRAAWFLLAALGVLPAKLLQVGSPSQPFFGKANVKEVLIDSSDWQTIRSLAMPAEYFYGHRGSPHESHEPTAARIGPWRPLRAGEQAEPTESFGIPDDAADELAAFDGENEGSLLHTAEAPIQREPADVPGLDEALQELGIHVGSAVLRLAAEQAGIAAGSHLPVLLLGETGTGKERFAHLIHRMSSRGSRDLVALNCAAIPESIAEDYLLGHMKGAFSGANTDNKGMFESADQSTLFLDEIAELTLEVQAKLLRVIQDGVVQRLGSTAPRKVDVRIVAASNRDLKNEVSAGRFREDLYFRLEVVQIKLPALRERRSEIPELALTLLRQINLRRHKPQQLSSGALLRLERYGWPGNVRQLSNVLERSVLYSRTDAIDADDLLITDDHPQKDPWAMLPEPSQGFSVEIYVGQVRKQLFLRALAVCKGNQAEAAAMLGVSKQAVSKFVNGQADNAS
jgi:DNA-binding NtrC family response regulator